MRVASLFVILVVAGFAAGTAGAQPAFDANRDLVARLAAAVRAPCAHPEDTFRQMASRLGPDVGLIHQQGLRDRAEPIGWQRSFALKPYGMIEVTRLAPPDARGHISAELQLAAGDRLLPVLSVLAGLDCAVIEARRLVYDGRGQLDRMIVLDAELEPTGASSPLNPPVPAAEAPDPGGVRIAVVDTGVNYLLPPIAAALARDSQGRALGYDFWDLDPYPFDSDTRRSAFYPMHQGTRTASVIVAEAPQARIVPYRFPFPDLGLMADLVRDADAAGARIVVISYAAAAEGDWDAFIEAAEARPNLLIIAAAGPGGRNLDVTAEPPATLVLPNVIVVTAADKRGRLLGNANYGPRSVHLAVAAEDVAVIDFSGRRGLASGTGIAAARLAAYAARLLATNPDWTMARLREGLLKAGRPPVGEPARTRHGVVVD
jgi:hypothetical protein